MSRRRVCVIGAGVIGVSTALNVLETVPNVTVTIITDNITPDTTSDVSGGYWEPHALSNTPIDKIKRWGGETFDYLASIADSEDADVAGVGYISGYIISRDSFEDPFWSDMVRGFRQMEIAELKPFGRDYKYGTFHTTVISSVKSYLPWLLQRFEKLGGNLIRNRVKNFDQLRDGYDVIVNCTGIGARELCADLSVVPVRGQVTKVEAPWLKHFLIDMKDSDSDTYILVGPDVVILGGTAEYASFNLEVDLSEKERMLKRCAKLYPSLKHAKVVGDYVGLRPTRPEVRLERENIVSGDRIIKVIHNYGHGGAGVTLHWGCAKEATQLVQRTLDDPPEASRL